ncbi:MarR family transcriptional regulator [Paenibacillus sp. N3/727]|uniref:MarR family winged helix-turn-helix transcriptional regulator n=1 Tax=Paenibacillus sp. N3/727 TaxID=2925845 RepID=UPI001F52CC11|nr:MarR family transcriptional regulator [Paenibacillus sp. N3/727]UNK21317.1 MarR family transcriptional regulator [Paenibacillus sp. N3/727]
MNTSNPQAIDVIHVLIRATHSVQREFMSQLSALNTPFHISGPRLQVLSIVSEAGKIRMNELAAKLGVKARTVTDFVDGLEKENLLVRTPDPTDRRATLIQLTELAESNISGILDIQTNIANKLIKKLTSTQRKELLDILFLLIEDKEITTICDGTINE